MVGNAEEIHDLGERAFYMFSSTRSTIIFAIASSFTEKLIAGGYTRPAIKRPIISGA
jgi:hypothetical protein